jgi:hypothetical protein
MEKHAESPANLLASKKYTGQYILGATKEKTLPYCFWTVQNGAGSASDAMCLMMQG